LSNYQQVKKSVTKLLHYEDVIAKADKFPHYTKKEFGVMQKHAGRLEKIVGGIRKMTWPVGAVVLVDVGRTESALKEAAKMGIPVVALVDTNDDPSLVDYVIPANDDAVSSVKLIVDALGNAAAAGVELVAQEREKRKAEAAKEREAAEKAKKDAPAVRPKAATGAKADAKGAAPKKVAPPQKSAAKPAAKPAPKKEAEASASGKKVEAKAPAAATAKKPAADKDSAANKKAEESKK